MSEEKWVLERARRLILDSNCAACHVVGAFPKGIEASKLPADRGAWLAEHVLLTPGGELARVPGARESLERRQKEKASEREEPVAAARTFLDQRPRMSEALARRFPGEGAKASEVLSSLDGARKEPFRPFVPAHVKVAGMGEGLPGRAIADKATGTPQSESGKFSPPILMDLGERVQPEWLFRFLKDPAWEYAKRGGKPIRPAVPLRMPTFGFTDLEAGDLVRYFNLASEAAYPFGDVPAPASPEVRRGMHDLLVKDGADCRSCHVLDGETKGAVGPDLDHVAGRLRRDWVRSYIQFPVRSQPFVVMPPHFTPKADGTLEPDNDVDPELNFMGRDPLRQLEAIVDYLMTPAAERGEPAKR